MEDEIQNQTIDPFDKTQGHPERGRMDEEAATESVKKDYLLPASILILAVIIAGAWVYTTGLKIQNAPQKAVGSSISSSAQKSGLEEKVLPSEGVVLPVRWGDLGVKMASVGVINKEKLESLYAGRGGLSGEEKKLLEDDRSGQLKITENNSGFLLNLFWALGLSTKNDILERGEMANPQYGGAGNFASTGGWTMAMGDAMEHYSRHPFIVLAPEQQQLVEWVSKNIYRPCCNNPTHFPDCNHGMAMLGLLELMASQGISEEEMYKVALQVNAYWFPDTYMTIAQYLASKGIDWDEASPKEILGANYSSGSGYRQILSQVTVPTEKRSGSCGV